MPPQTINANVLLGWFDRDKAVAYLSNRCIFDEPVTPERAEQLWRPYYDRVQALPERNPLPTPLLPMPAGTKGLVTTFMRRNGQGDVKDVVCINPMELAIYQEYVVIDRADHHERLQEDWPRKTLVIDRPNPPLPMRVEGDTAKFSLPHAEFGFGLIPQERKFEIQQYAGFVSVVDVGGGRLLLKAGYHRSFAFARAVMNVPDANAKGTLVALTRSLPPQLQDQGLRAMVFGPRAPLFRDFFDRDLAMVVKLRKKKWEAHLRIAEVDDEA